MTILFLFNMFDVLGMNNLFASNKTEGPVVKATREVNHALLDIYFSSGKNILKKLQHMWGNEPKFQEFKKNLEANYRECELKAQAENWTKSTWRSDRNIKCGKSELNPDEFRRFVIKQFEEMSTDILVRTKMISDSSVVPLKWLAIGTFSPDSDIDTVANNLGNQQNQYLPKIVAEVRAKSLFDALGLAMFGRPTGYNFDTESYIDVTTDLKKSEYEERIKNPNYQNLAFTLAFAQIARQLHHEIKLNDSKIYSYDDFKKSLEGSSMRSLLEDANKFASETAPDHDPTKNIEKYLPIINHLAQKIASISNPDEASKLKGILGAYFPEAYYTREALAHVCYSDDRYSQVLLQMIDTHLKDEKNNNKISPENIDEFKQKTITPNKFIYAVSALENLGYFFHKLDGKSTPYEALKNASKYFFRIARALAGYWEVDVDTLEENQLILRQPEKKQKKNGTKIIDRSISIMVAEKEYVKVLFQISSKLERLKRGFLPFSSPKDAQASLTKLVNAFEIKNLDTQKLAQEIYRVHIDLGLSKTEKMDALKKLKEDFKVAIAFDETSKRFDLIKTSSQTDQQNTPQIEDSILHLADLAKETVKAHVALEVSSLLNLIIGATDGIRMSVQKINEENILKQKGLLPYWQDKKIKQLNEFMNVNPKSLKKFTGFLNGLTSFIKHTLQNYKDTHKGFEYRAVKLADDTEKEIAAANPHGNGLLKTHGHSK